MHTTVASRNVLLIALWTAASRASSTADVASSSSNSLDRRRHARAKQSSCRSPNEKLRPPSSTCASRDVRASNCASTRALRTSSSDDALKGSTLKRTSPEKSTGSCGIIETRLLRDASEHRRTSTPSTLIELPEEGGANRNKASKKDDFPEPPC